MEKLLFKNALTNTIIGGILIVLAIVFYFTGWIGDFLGILVGVIVGLVSLKRFFDAVSETKVGTTRTILFVEIVVDLFAAFMMITQPSKNIGLYLGLVLYARGLAGLLIHYFLNKRQKLILFLLNILFLTGRAYFLFGGNPRLDVLEIVITILVFLLGGFFLYFGVKALKK
jgi:hypothetical protein